LLRDLFFPEKRAMGLASKPVRFGYDPLRNQIYRALVSTGIRKRNSLKERNDTSSAPIIRFGVGKRTCCWQ
jgi:hypothetical protein